MSMYVQLYSRFLIYLRIYLEFLAGQSDSSDDPLGMIVSGAADKGAPNSGSLKSI